MPSKCFDAVTSIDIPQLHRLIGAPTDEGLTVGTKADGTNFIRVSSQCFDAVARIDIPEFYRTVKAATRQDFTTRTESD